MERVFGFLGSSVAAIFGILATAAFITFFLILWKAGALPVVGEAILIVLKAIFHDIPLAILDFLKSVNNAI